MKFRYIVLCWIVLLGVGLIPLFMKTGRRTRDMVYYNSQVNAIADGGAVPEGCEVIWVSDSDYAARQNTYLKNGALVMDIIQDGVIKGKAVWNDAEEEASETERSTMAKMLTVWGIAAVSGSALLIFIYAKYIRPFKRLGKFAGEVARGNLDFPLGVGRNDFFGAFTESFDIMREELKASREREAAAVRSRKELVAELSHDIKTPVASIKAMADVMSLTAKDDMERETIAAINGKADQIDRLISNLFHATLEELEQLEVKPEELSSTEILQMIREADHLRKIVDPELKDAVVLADRLRLNQVISNIISNSYKYANTEIRINSSYEETGRSYLVIEISDNGGGVPEEELELVTEKFKRGSNTGGKEGSGLGLYISKYFMEKMEGSLECFNRDGGFTVRLKLPVA